MATSEAVDQRSITYINNDLEELKKRYVPTNTQYVVCGRSLPHLTFDSSDVIRFQV